MPTKFFIYFTCLLYFLSTRGQSENIPGIPFFKNLKELENLNQKTVYDIDEGKNGTIYLATAGSLVSFDGFRLARYNYPGQTDLRAIYYKNDDYIFSGGHGGFGYWSRKSNGELEYTSLYYKNISSDDTLLPIFFNISEQNGKILFQTWQEIFFYDLVTCELSSIRAKTGFVELFVVNNRAFIQDQGGLYEIINQQLSLIDNTKPENFQISNVLPFGENSIAIITKDAGLWLIENGSLKKEKSQINTLLEKYVVTDAKVFNKDKFVITTLRSGVLVVSGDGEVLLDIKKSDGLASNRILSSYLDSNDNLWIGSDEGVTYIQINTNTKYLIDTDGQFGSVYTSILKDSILYLGTNQGLYSMNWHEKNSKPKLFDNQLSQIWTMEVLQESFLVGAHEGVFEFFNGKLQSILDDKGAWLFRVNPNNPDILYVGLYSGISVLERKEDKWKFVKKWSDFGESSRFMEFDRYGYLWVAHPEKGYYRLSLSRDGIDLIDFEFYKKISEHEETYSYMSVLDDDLVFFDKSGFYSYNSLDFSFEPDKYASKIFSGISNINYIKQHGNTFWFSSETNLGYVTREANSFEIISSPFYPAYKDHLNDFNRIERLNDSIYSIGLRNGILFHELNNSNLLDNSNHDLQISYINLISTKDTIKPPFEFNKTINIPHDYNFVKIGLMFPNSIFTANRTIKYRLKGLSDEWSHVEEQLELVFPNLKPGDYELQISLDLINESTPDYSVPIKVLKPWYTNNYAIIFYILCSLVLFAVYRAFLNNKSIKKLNRLKFEEEEKRRKQAEEFKVKILSQEHQVLLLEQENLRLEMKKKNSQLAATTYNSVKKNELINKILNDLTSIVVDSKTDLRNELKRAIRRVRGLLNENEDWLSFELNFKKAHTDFFDSLLKAHPELNPAEVKLCAYLKLNLSTKEISSLLNISIRSVDQARWRLRKRLGLNRDANLSAYMNSI